jgi:radical SAM-linked protein
VQSPSEPPERAADTGTSGVRETVQRWRLVFAREVRADSPGQRDQLAAWDAALLASALPIAGLDAPRPKPRLVLAAPLGSGVRGEAELADLWLVERLPCWRVREALSANLPIGHSLVGVYDVWLGESALPGRVAASVYRATVALPADGDALARAAATLLEAETLPRDRRKGDATVSYDLRPFLAALEVRSAVDGAEIRMTLRHDPARGIGRPEEALAALSDALGGLPLEAKGLVRESLVLAEPPPPEPAAPRAPRRPPPNHPGPNRRPSPPRDG